jgi:hypothetical protein
MNQPVCSVHRSATERSGLQHSRFSPNTLQDGEVKAVLTSYIICSTDCRTEKNLSTCDIEFPIEDSIAHPCSFQIILSSTNEADDDIIRKVKQLSNHKVGKRGLVLLMEGVDSMTSFMKLQLRCVLWNEPKKWSTF